ncbi:hypothetical protein C4573_03630 [Candidatus Woesearchaeota archaeon]|nr:MAG: hypothetical protein C4573_03630 [Candidatus Woesearchaeota archaeon]
MKEEKKPILLEGDLGNAVAEAYRRRVQEEFPNHAVLTGLKWEGGTVRYANTYSLVLLNQVLHDFGYQVATLRDIEDAMDSQNSLVPQIFTYQTGIVLTREPSKSARYLVRELGSRIGVSYGQKLELPLMISLQDLELIDDKRAMFGLTFYLPSYAKVIPAPEFNEKYHLHKFGDADRNGLPVLDSDGNRTLHLKPAKKTGLYKVEVPNKDALFANDERLEHAQRNYCVAVVKK